MRIDPSLTEVTTEWPTQPLFGKRASKDRRKNDERATAGTVRAPRAGMQLSHGGRTPSSFIVPSMPVEYQACMWNTKPACLPRRDRTAVGDGGCQRTRSGQEHTPWLSSCCSRSRPERPPPRIGHTIRVAKHRSAPGKHAREVNHTTRRMGGHGAEKCPPPKKRLSQLRSYQPAVALRCIACIAPIWTATAPPEACTGEYERSSHALQLTRYGTNGIGGGGGSERMKMGGKRERNN